MYDFYLIMVMVNKFKIKITIKISYKMEKLQFTDKATTKEQYLKFKEFIKSEKYHAHRDYVAYYIFKHRLNGEERDEYLEDEI